MRKSSGFSLVVLAWPTLCLLGAADGAIAAVHECKGMDGSTTYADAPCSADARALTPPQVGGPAHAPLSSGQATIAPQIARALYVSPHNNRQLDVTAAVSSRCRSTPSRCDVSCNNQLAGDPEFGQRKYCKITYRCSQDSTKELVMQEGETKPLTCPASLQREVAPSANVQIAGDVALKRAHLSGSVPTELPSSTTSPTDFRILSSMLLAKQAVKKGILTAVASDGGGLFTAGVAANDEPEYFKISKQGAIEWRQIPSDPAIRERPGITGLSKGGGYWVMGTARTRNLTPEESTGPGWVERSLAVSYDYIRRIDQGGHVSVVQKIASVAGAHSVSCGTAVPGGYVLAGWIDGGVQHARHGFPWMEMIDSTGKQIWSRSFSEDHGQQIVLEPGAARCAGILATADGTVTWAVSVRTAAITPAGNTGATRSANWGQDNLATFLVQIDRNGAEVRRIRRDSVTNAFLFSTGTGFTLFERTVAKAEALAASASQADMMHEMLRTSRAASAASGVRITRFDLELNERSAIQYLSPEFDHSIDAVYLTPAGSFLAGGCDNGNNVLNYVGPSGQIARSLSASPAGQMQECSSFTFGGSEVPSTALLLASNDLWGARTLLLQYPK